MQLDRTHLVIRVRTLSEIGDLALLLLRRYPRGVFLAFLMGAVPWILVDIALLGWIPLSIDQQEFFDEDSAADLFRYGIGMVTLISLQTPLAGMFSTLYLGLAVFEKRPTMRQIWRDGLALMGRAIWTLGILRLAIPITVLYALTWMRDYDPFRDSVVPLAILVYVAITRGSRPFLPEMLLLERCPRKSRSANVVTLSRRSKLLHAPISSDLGGRFLMTAFVLGVLSAAVFYTLIFARGIALNRWSLDAIAWLLFFPASLWTVAAISVIVRLLSYLDARIRLEGWEVELAFRAEAMRQFGHEDPLESVPVAANRGSSSEAANAPAAAAEDDKNLSATAAQT
ncbi:MAG: hypothetical protein AAGD07_02700 [Planctomycetota bacterium]